MHRAKLSTVELAYVDHGIGPPILLVHGFPLDHSMWSAQIDALAGRYRVIAPDLRGFGESSLGDADPEVGVSMERYADDLAELLDVLAVADPVVLVGFSMGGYIAWQFVRKHAVRLRALIQCDTRAAASRSVLALARASRLLTRARAMASFKVSRACAAADIGAPSTAMSRRVERSLTIIFGSWDSGRHDQTAVIG